MQPEYDIFIESRLKVFNDLLISAYHYAYHVPSFGSFYSYEAAVNLPLGKPFLISNNEINGELNELYALHWINSISKIDHTQ